MWYEKILDNVPLKGKLSPKPAGVWVITESAENAESFTLLGKMGCVRDVR